MGNGSAGDSRSQGFAGESPFFADNGPIQSLRHPVPSEIQLNPHRFAAIVWLFLDSLPPARLPALLKPASCRQIPVYGRLAEKCRRVFVGGESMGGLVALYLASQHPQIAGVLAYAPGIKLTLSKLDILKLHLAAPVTTQVGRASLDRADVWQGYPGLPLKAAQQLLKFRQATEQRLAQVTCPLLVFQGRLDTSVQPGAGEFLFQHVRSTIKEQHWMEESSHVILLDKEMEKVVQITVEFMERV